MPPSSGSGPGFQHGKGLEAEACFAECDVVTALWSYQKTAEPGGGPVDLVVHSQPAEQESLTGCYEGSSEIPATWCDIL